MFRNGEFVSQYIEPKVEDEELSEEQIQPNGVDLRIGELYDLSGIGVLRDDEYRKTERKKKSTRIEPTSQNGAEMYNIGGGAYIIEYAEIIEIPEDHIGIVFPRSRVNRCGANITSALWDAGYRGKGEGCLLTMQSLHIEENMRIAQIAFAKTEELEKMYDGSHQSENL